MVHHRHQQRLRPPNDRATAQRGDRVAGTARKLEALDELKTQYGQQLWLASLDVTDTPAIHRVVCEAFATFGRIDAIVNNAGYGLFGAAEELSDDQIRHQIDTNVIGSTQVIRAALPRLDETQKRYQQAGLEDRL